MLDRYQLKRNRSLSLIRALNPNNKTIKRMENKYLDAKLKRRCIKCGIIKEINEYGLAKNRRLGINDCCKFCTNKKKKIYDEKNKELISEKYKSMWKNDIEYKNKCKKSWIEWRNRNRGSRYEYCKQWRVKNKDKVKVYDINKAIKRNKRKCKLDDKTIKPESIKYILIAQDYKCIECLINIEKTYTLDHCKSLADGGAHSINNIQLMCKTCNCRKHTKSYRIIDGEKIYL